MKNFWKNKEILVTGGNGFIGSNIVIELLKRGSSVTITVTPRTTDKELNNRFKDLLPRLNIIRADLTNYEACLRATNGKRIVLNLAALDGGAEFKRKNAAKIYKVNTEIVKNILKSSIENEVERVLLMSSIEVYDKNSKKEIITENSKLSDERNGYIGAKIYSEKLAKKYFEKYGLKIAIARPGNIYGEGDTIDNDRLRVLPAIISKAKKGQDIEIQVQNRSFLHVSDLVNSLLILVEKYANCDPVNIVSSEIISLEELAKMVIKINKSKSKIILRSSSNPNYKFVSTKKYFLNLNSMYNMERGLKKLLKYYEKSEN